MSGKKVPIRAAIFLIDFFDGFPVSSSLNVLDMQDVAKYTSLHKLEMAKGA